MMERGDERATGEMIVQPNAYYLLFYENISYS